MSSDETIPKLRRLACQRFARSLCQHVIKCTPIPEHSSIADAAYFEELETESLGSLNQTYESILPKTCLDEAFRHIEAVVTEMRNDLEGLGIKESIIHVMMAEKWNDFVVSWWSTRWQPAGDIIFLGIFVTITNESEPEGLDDVPEGDLAVCLDIWHVAPEEWKLNTFSFTVRSHTRLTTYPQMPLVCSLEVSRNLKFVTKLFGDFDVQTRLGLWTQNWLDIMHGTRPIHLEPLMRLCCDDERSFDEFKTAWLSRPETIERYYCMLINVNHLDELNEFINFYSSDRDKQLQLAIVTLRTYLIINPLPESFPRLINVILTITWLKVALFAPEFEYLRHLDEAKLQSHYCKLIAKAEYEISPIFLKIFLQKSDVSTVEKRYVETFFLKNTVPNDVFYSKWFNPEAFKKLPQFDEFLKRVFDSEASDFKKRLIYAPCTLDSLRDLVSSGIENSKIDDFVRLCLSCDRERAEWQDTFMRDIIKGLRKGLNLADLRYRSFNLIKWCVNSDEKLAKLKSIICIDELFEIFAQCNDTRNYSAKFFFYNYFALKELLNKWYPQIDDRIEFKLEKLRDYSPTESVLDAVLGVLKNKFLACDTDEQKRQVVAKTYEEEPDE